MSFLTTIGYSESAGSGSKVFENGDVANIHITPTASGTVITGNTVSAADGSYITYNTTQNSDGTFYTYSLFFNAEGKFQGSSSMNFDGNVITVTGQFSEFSYSCVIPNNANAYSKEMFGPRALEFAKQQGWCVPVDDSSEGGQLTITHYAYGGTEYLGVSFVDALGNNLGEYFPGGTVTVGPLTGENGEILDSRTFISDSAGFYEALDTAIGTSGYIDYIGNNTNIVGINNSNGIYSNNFVGGVLAAGGIANTGDYIASGSMMSAYNGAVDMLYGADYAGLMDPWMISDSMIDPRVSSYVAQAYGVSVNPENFGNYTGWALSVYFDVHKALFPNLEFDQWILDFSNDFASNGSPIVIDLNGDGIQTTSILTDAVNFDLTGDGQKERTAWLSGQDGFLAHDDNHNGHIDNISELFGGLGRGDGYAKLSEWDTNADSIINVLDAGYKQLSIWQDVNQNGLTDTGELRSLSEVGLTSLSLSYSVQDSLSNGNFIGELSNAQVNGSIVEMGDVYFQYYPTNSLPVDINRPQASELIAATPNQSATELSGFEHTSSVARTLIATDARVAADSSVVLQQIRSAIQESKYQSGLSARIQAYMGEIKLIVNGSGVVIDYTKLKASFNQTISSNYDLGVKDLVNFNLLQKGNLEGWDGWGVLSSVLSTNAPSKQVSDFLIGKNIKTLGLAGFDGTGSLTPEIIIGNVAGNVLNGNDGDDEIYGLSGNDTISGGNGKDVIYGGSGSDILNGGAGSDTLVGGDGNDIFILDSTTDTITETATGGTDTVQSSFTYTLGSTSNLENLKLIGTAAINATGNALNNVITGNSAANIINGGAGVDTLVGGDGNDTYIVDSTTDTVTETATGGVDSVQSSVTYTLGATSNLENLTLIGSAAINGAGNALNNALAGNAANNTLTGGAGNDTLNGGAGTDTLIGGDGNDIYVVDSTTDTITETATSGVDTVQSSVTFTLGATSNLENLTLTGIAAISGTGNLLNNILIGNAASNTLNGGAGNDTLNGAAGIDTLVGGDGNDTYVVDNTTDTITETFTGGIDTVQSSVTFTLGATSNLDNLTLTGSTAINATGNALNNVITGNSGANTLNGWAGVDTLKGGAGDDIYIVDTTTDTLVENLNEGTDTVQSSVSLTLVSNIENLTLTGTTAINGTGNALNNTLTGNAVNNTLTGGAGNDALNGSAGTDTLIGGDGNDTYLVDSTTDTITETATGGIDTVQSSVTFTLGATSNLENLTLTGTAVINATGNALDNVLTGNSANNTLTGGAGKDNLNGGAGTDALIGGDGNDIYVVDTTTDTITETSTGGLDTVQSSVTFTLGASSNLENLSLTGTAAINGTGNALSNFLKGNSANNTLTDTAGGNDILQGLAGVDTFSDTAGNNLIDGGLGADTITVGSGRDIIVGGKDNDTITTGTGYDVILFNKGDGTDTINTSVGTDNTLSLGGNFAYSDLSLTKSSNDLILKMGSSDQITLKGWYNTSANNKSVLNLQVIAEAMQGFSLGGADALRNNKVETFKFANLVAAFDAAGATANWQLTDARLSAHLSAGRDTAAIGGDLAYQYGKAGSLAGVGLLAAQAVINNPSVGQTAQALNAASSWTSEIIRLA